MFQILSPSYGDISPFWGDFASPLSPNTSIFGNPANINPGSGRFTSLNAQLAENFNISSFKAGLQGNNWGAGYSYNEKFSQYQIANANELFSNTRMGLSLNLNTINGNYNWAGDLGLSSLIFSFCKLGYYTQNLLSSRTGDSVTQFAGIGLRPLSRINAAISNFTLSWLLVSTGVSLNSRQNSVSWISGTLPVLPWLILYGRTQLKDSKQYSIGLSIQASPHQLIAMQNFKTSGVVSTEFSTQISSKIVPNHVKVREGYVIIDLNTNIVEGRTTLPFWGQPGSIGILNIKDQFKAIVSLKGIKKVIIKTGYTRCSWALAMEVINELNSLKNKRINITAYMEHTSRTSYLLASAADHIIVVPSGYFGVTGLNSEVSLYKGLLNNIGAEAQFVKRGQYKSYPEVFTSDSMSSHWKSNLTQTINSLWDNYLNSISKNRGIHPDTLSNFFLKPVVSLDTAKAYGLIDTMMYEDEMINQLGNNKFYRIYLKNTSLINTVWGTAPRFALILLSGTITSGSSRTEGLLFGQTSGSQSLAAQLKKARLDKSIKAIILRVNSPGGSAVDSDIITRELTLLKQSQKPIIVSVGSMCASGAYYIASQADKIVAEGNSIIGSIGIFGGKLILKDLYNKAGITKEIIKTTPTADAMSTMRPWTVDEKNALQKYMDDFYHSFVKKVKTGRGLNDEETDSIAEGRIFTGDIAIKNKLIDEIGGLDKAISIAKNLVQLPQQTKISLVIFESEQSFPQDLFNMNSRPVKQLVEEWRAFFNTFSNTQIWAMSPEAMVLEQIFKGL